MKNLWLCYTFATPFGRFGDYVWAVTLRQARRAFFEKHGCWPITVVLERKCLPPKLERRAA